MKRLASAVGGVCLAVALGACGGEGGEHREASTKEGAAPSAPPAESAAAASAAPAASGEAADDRSDGKDDDDDDDAKDGRGRKGKGRRSGKKGKHGKKGKAGFAGGEAELSNRHVPAPQRAAAGSAYEPSEPTSTIAIDPNGRFATTYRPGGGHLAAFESAISRGIIPEAEREIVSDVGARYTPDFDVPAGASMAFRVGLERRELAPSGGAFHVRIALRSADAKPAERPHLSVHLVLDVSGSMAGSSIEHARQAARAVVDKLAPSDDFSFVTFSDDANVLVADESIAGHRDAIKRVIDGVHEGGGTNIGKGLSLGYAQAANPKIPADAVKVVLLVSDGRANIGITSPDRLSKLALDAFQSGVQTSAFGLGNDYDGALMSSIAADGAGGYYYMRDAEQIAPALATEIDKRLDPVATALEVRVRLKPDVELLRVYGSRRLSESEARRVRATEVAADKQAEKRDHIESDRQDDTAGGMRFFIPAFAPDDSHALLLQLKAPPGSGQLAVATVEIKYKDRVSKKNRADELVIKASYADGDAESAATIDKNVAKTVQGFAAGEALAAAAAKIAVGDRARAAALLEEREDLLRTAAKRLKEPGFLKDADRLARLRSFAESGKGLGDPLVLALMMETAARSHLH